MENKLIPFQNEEFGEVRVFEIDSEPWFVASDVCRALEIVNVGNALARLDDDEKGSIRLTDVTPNGGNPNVSIVNEPGLYTLVLGSRKKEAKDFKRWITHDVIPSIRKTGSYSMMPKTFAEALRAYADEVEKREKLEFENKMLAPKAEYFDTFVDRQLLTNFRDTAKELEMGQKEFMKFLETHGYIYRNSMNKPKPYMKYVDMGYFKIKDVKNKRNDHVDTQTLVTAQGKEAFRVVLNMEKDIE